MKNMLFLPNSYFQKRLEILNLLTLNIKLLITTTHSRQLANFLPVMLQYDHVFVASRKKSNKTAGLWDTYPRFSAVLNKQTAKPFFTIKAKRTLPYGSTPRKLGYPYCGYRRYEFFSWRLRSERRGNLAKPNCPTQNPEPRTQNPCASNL